MSTDNKALCDFHGKTASSGIVASQFRKSGYVILRNIYNKQFVDELHSEFTHRYKHHLGHEEKEDALTVGDKRYKTSITLEQPFDSIELLANEYILPILKNIIDEHLVLASVVCVTSLPGADEQSTHRDHPWLFGTPIDRLLPSYAIKLLIPLVPMNAETGTTRVWPESQNNLDATALQQGSVDPLLDTGDCMLTDYNLMHQGLANTSAQVRPVLFLSYARHWFRDEQNFKKQTHLLAPMSTHKALLQKNKSLFSRLQVET